MDFMTETTYLCEPATESEFLDTFWRTIDGSPVSSKKLQQITCRISDSTIPEESIRSLWVIGNADSYCNEALKTAKLNPGVYINRSTNQLLLIHPEETDICKYTKRFGKQLTNLTLSLTAFSNLDLSSLTSLVHLWIGHDACLSRISGLEHLNQLSELKISKCDKLNSLSSFGNSAQLTTLFLSECSSLTQLQGLENLTQLKKLSLIRCDSLVQLPNLGKLTLLKELSLSECINLTQLDGLESLTQLRKLSLFKCRSLVQLPGLEKLIRLKEATLAQCSSLIKLPTLDNLSQIIELSLSGCSNLRVLPDGIRNMKSLRRLVLRHLRLQYLPDWLPEIAERFSLEKSGWQRGKNKAIVYLYNTIADDINDMSIFEQPYEMVVNWFEERKLGRTHPLNEIKVVFLGDGESGKSYTIARLMNNGGNPVGYVNARTPGIVIKDVEYSIGGRNVTLHLWDFGGQDIMHSMHRIFLTSRTLYVVLVDGSIGNQDERARYWLQNIQSFAKDAPVVLMLNKLDDNLQADVNAVDLRNKYKGLKQIIKLSALQYSQERFNQEFKDVLMDEIEKTGYLDVQWPSKWIQVKKALEQMNENYIHGIDYLKICRDLNVDDNQKPLLQWFHDLGISFCYCDNENKALEDYVVLKPNWITNALYIILFNEREGGNGGLVPISTIRNMLGWDAHNKEAIKRVIPDAYYVGYDVNYVLDVFHAFSLSFKTDEQYEFFPMLADVNAKPIAKEYAEAKDCLEFNMEFDYLPSNLLHRLMVERNSELDINNVWRTGAKFELKELGYSAVVVIDGKVLRFFIRHTNPVHRPNSYLAILKANVDRIVAKMGLNTPTNQLIYKINDKQDIFDYEMLKVMLEEGQKQTFSMTWRRMIPIADILNQSAPDGLEEEMQLLSAIQESCGKIQDEPIYWLRKNESGIGYVNGRGMEDLRNRRIRDDLITVLRGKGYGVYDQTQAGSSGSGKGIGELDLLIRKDNNEPWTIIEALRVSDGSKSDWNAHLDKLTGKYNSRGLPLLYLLTYVDADPKTFAHIWNGYKDHIKNYNPGQFSYFSNSFIDLNDTNSPQYIKRAKCQYTCGGDPITVYHIFARIPILDK